MRRKDNDKQCEPYRIRLPGFVVDHDIGLGEVIKKGISYLGIRPCRGCEARSARLNRRVVFTRTTQALAPARTRRTH
jgi:hypothetical protein